MRKLYLFSLLFIFSLGLISCDSSKNFAPVTDLGAEHAHHQGYYLVQPGETIYFIAWRMGVAYQDLVYLNHLSAPYLIKPGTKLLVSSGMQPEVAKKIKTSASLPPEWISKWKWPAKGNVLKHYTIATKGIDISGKLGSPILASAAGEVVYTGSGLSSYGNLIIVKHNEEYMSVYAHNQVILVTVGQHVSKGQKIAKMGSTGTNRVILHFEIRKFGKPVDPLLYLPH